MMVSMMYASLISSSEFGIVVAAITSHNVIILHADLTRHPEVAFFVSPIPIHVAALLITFSTIIKVDTLALGLAADDVGMAIRIVPYFRWRWSNKHRENQLVNSLAHRTYGSLLSTTGPISPPIWYPEHIWISSEVLSSNAPPKLDEVMQAGPGNAPLQTGLGESHHARREAPDSLQKQLQAHAEATENPIVEEGYKTLRIGINIDKTRAEQAVA